MVMKNIGGKIVICVVVLVMLIPIIIEMRGTNILKTIDYSGYEKFVSDTSNHKFSLLYIGKDDKDAKTEVKNIVNDIAGNQTQIETSAFFMDADKLTDADSLAMLGSTGVKTGYVFAVNGEVVRIETTALDSKKVSAYVKEFTSQGVDESIRYYKVAKDAKEYKELVKDKKKVTMAVFGRDTCTWCNLFKPVYNTVAEEYNLDIYYFDSDSYDKTEYQKIMDMGLTLPASCNNGKEQKLSDGFGTPLTVFTKNGKVVDCISSGYLNKSALITKLQTVGMIKE